ncbi:MAG TPA: F0F1 ATP synthase subunit A [Kiritimatiellia bacterium]|nr:F0F1 ATP synthase subunit A [Kiritimatiellia bacterium]HRZ11016.1 F0F1 ATP synthase subunit A [Kiritimatiellia bacterium]HSA18589.1 F0F1 ATP synthase subunit A [Kiritimatiellia bacterium]
MTAQFGRFSWGGTGGLLSCTVSLDVTSAVAAAETSVETRTAVHDYIVRHAMYHMAESDSWNLPYVHLRFLDIFRYDATMVIVSALLLVAAVSLIWRRRRDPPRGMTALLEFYVLFIRDKICGAFIGDRLGRRLTPYFCTLFLFILTMNLLGLVPLFSAATNNINVTGALALLTLGLMLVGSVFENGLRGPLKAMAPPGVPWPLLIILVPVEFISTLGKAFALMIRLFANILAGHVIIFCLLGLVVILGYAALPAILLAIVLFFFELFVCFFQAYIFTLLSAIFIGQFVHAEH